MIGHKGGGERERVANSLSPTHSQKRSLLVMHTNPPPLFLCLGCCLCLSSLDSTSISSVTERRSLLSGVVVVIIAFAVWSTPRQYSISSRLGPTDCSIILRGTSSSKNASTEPNLGLWIESHILCRSKCKEDSWNVYRDLIVKKRQLQFNFSSFSWQQKVRPTSTEIQTKTFSKFSTKVTSTLTHRHHQQQPTAVSSEIYFLIKNWDLTFSSRSQAVALKGQNFGPLLNFKKKIRKNDHSVRAFMWTSDVRGTCTRPSAEANYFTQSKFFRLRYIACTSSSSSRLPEKRQLMAKALLQVFGSWRRRRIRRLLSREVNVIRLLHTTISIFVKSKAFGIAACDVESSNFLTWK